MRSFSSALVTGATGFIGSALVARLLADEVRVICLVRDKRKLNGFERSHKLQVIETPSFETSALKERLGNESAEVIFNLASYGVQQQDRDVDGLIEGNAGLVLHLLEAVAKWRVLRFIHAGSCSEYGFPEKEGQLISERQSLRPTSLYGAAKAASVLMGSAFASQVGVPFLSLRLFGVFGMREARERLVPYMIHRLEQDQPVDLTPGEQVRDFLFEDDVVNAFLKAAGADLDLYEAYNVCSAKPTRVRELGELVAGALQKPRELLQWGKRQYRTDEPMWLVGDNRRFVDATSWRPAVTLTEGIRRIVARGLPSHSRSGRLHAI